MIELEPGDGGVIVPVHAQPKARRNAITGLHAGRLKVAVTSAPEKGKANDAIRDVLVRELGLKSSQVKLVSGATSTQKRFLITGLTPIEVQRRIATALQSD